MGTNLGAVLERPVANSACKHHWLIEPPSGPTSKGMCKLCGEVKVFDNILADLLSAKDASALSEPANVVGGEGDSDGDSDGKELSED